MRITFIGTGGCIPDVGRESPCFLLNGRHLVDTGWNAVLKMRELGLDPLGIESLILTHLHQDHYLGLPHLLFFLGLNRRRRVDRPPLQIYGPTEHLDRVFLAAQDFLQVGRFPELRVECSLFPLSPGDRFELEDMSVEAAAASHTSGRDVPEPALMYRVVEKPGGATLAFTGDTYPHPPVAAFAEGASVLIHDGAHTPPQDAAMVAREAGVERLLLIHYPNAPAQRILAEARAVFAQTDLAEDGMSLDIPGSA